MRVYFFIAVIFFLCGLSTILNTILAPYLQQVMSLSYTSVTSLYVSFYLAYLLCAPIAGFWFRRGNYLFGIRIALLLCTFGSYGVFLGGTYHSFPFVLAGLFVMACGICILQVNANPYVLNYGPRENASSRLSFLQGFFAFGTVTAPFLGSWAILAALYHPETGSLLHEFLDILPLQMPYYSISLSWALAYLFFELVPLPEVRGLTETERSEPLKKSLVAVGVEVAIGNYLIPFIADRAILDVTLDTAGELAILYWIGFMLGRFLSGALFQDADPRIVLYYHAGAGIVLTLLGSLFAGWVAAISLIATGLTVSILFPVLFALLLEEGSKSQMRLSGYLMMANIGGGLIPVLQGLSADYLGIHLSFLVPAICFAIILAFSMRRPKFTPIPIRVKK